MGFAEDVRKRQKEKGRKQQEGGTYHATCTRTPHFPSAGATDSFASRGKQRFG